MDLLTVPGQRAADDGDGHGGRRFLFLGAAAAAAAATGTAAVLRAGRRDVRLIARKPQPRQVARHLLQGNCGENDLIKKQLDQT